MTRLKALPRLRINVVFLETMGALVIGFTARSRTQLRSGMLTNYLQMSAGKSHALG
jgi:hypothetical protein